MLIVAYIRIALKGSTIQTHFIFWFHHHPVVDRFTYLRKMMQLLLMLQMLIKKNNFVFSLKNDL